MKDLGKNPFFYLSILLILVVGFSVWSFVQAKSDSFQGPTESFPGGNPAQPVDESVNANVKKGTFSVDKVGDEVPPVKISPNGGITLDFGNGNSNPGSAPTWYQAGLRIQESGIKFGGGESFWSTSTQAGAINYTTSTGEGRVGIGTESPSSTLDVKGNVSVRGTILAEKGTGIAANYYAPKGNGEGKLSCRDGYAMVELETARTGGNNIEMTDPYKIHCIELGDYILDSGSENSVGGTGRDSDSDYVGCGSNEVATAIRFYKDDGRVDSVQDLYCSELNNGLTGSSYWQFRRTERNNPTQRCPHGTFVDGIATYGSKAGFAQGSDSVDNFKLRCTSVRPLQKEGASGGDGGSGDGGDPGGDPPKPPSDEDNPQRYKKYN